MSLRDDYTLLEQVVFQLCKEDEANNNSNNNNENGLNSSQHQANFSKFSLKNFFSFINPKDEAEVDGSAVELQNYERISIKSGALVEANASDKVDDLRWRKHSTGANPFRLPTSRFHHQNKRHQSEFQKYIRIVLALVKKGFLQQSRCFE